MNLLRNFIKEEIENLKGVQSSPPWRTIAHHVTLNMGKWKGDRSEIGTWFPISVLSISMDDNVLAVAVDLPRLPIGPPPENSQLHITVGVNSSNPKAKPFMSNNLDWSNQIPIQGLDVLKGQLQETGNYTGLVLSPEDHVNLVNAVSRSINQDLLPNLKQNPPLAQNNE